MFFTGFADEASKDFAKQLEATKLLGWSNIEARSIYDGNLASIDEATFEKVATLLADNNCTINSFGSTIANWQCHPRSEEDFQNSITQLKNAIPRMHQLGTKIVRCMSFLVPKDEQFDSPELEQIIFKKVKYLVDICEDNGIIYGHENCMNYAGQSPLHTLKLVEAMNSKAFSLIFDTGNPVFTFYRVGEKPYKLQNAFDFYKQVKEHISYVHIKDAIAQYNEDGSIALDDEGKVKAEYTFAGEGEGCVKEIITDLLASGYDGGFSIEPHMATVFHEKDSCNNDEAKAKKQFDTYVEYGRRFEALFNSLKKQ